MHPNQRFRLQPKKGGSTNEWFRYDGAKHQDNGIKRVVLLLAHKHRSIENNIYEKTAKQVLPYLEKAEEWWTSNLLTTIEISYR
jgi:hypothetical protein